MTALAQRSPASASTSSATSVRSRDVHAWEAAVRRLLRPDRVELVDGSSRQRHRLLARAARHGTLDATAAGPSSRDLSVHRLADLLTPHHRDLWDDDAVPPLGGVATGRATGAGDGEDLLRAEVMRRFTGASRGRPLWLVPFADPAATGPRPALGVLATDSHLAVLALQEAAGVGSRALRRVEAGEPWAALVHSVGLPLADEHGHALRDDVPWPRGARWCARLRGGSEVWSCGTPVAWT